MLALEEMALRLVVATVLGALVGLERERPDRGAGLRTHAVTAVGSCLFMLVSSFGFADIQHEPNVSLDPSRVASQVASGIGFLGAGTIIMRKEVIHGLTTAATLWAVAAVGLAAGGGLFPAAVITTVLTLGITLGLRPLEQRLAEVRQPLHGRSITLRCRPGTEIAARLERLLAGAGLEMKQLVVSRGAAEEGDCVEVMVAPCEEALLLRVVEGLRGVEGVTRVTLDSPRGFQKGTTFTNME